MTQANTFNHWKEERFKSESCESCLKLALIVGFIKDLNGGFEIFKLICPYFSLEGPF
jgi:hypothetical protein